MKIKLLFILLSVSLIFTQCKNEDANNQAENTITTTPDNILEGTEEQIRDGIIGKWHLVRLLSNNEELPVEIYGEYFIEFEQPNLIIQTKSGYEKRANFEYEKFMIKNNSDNAIEEFKIFALTKDSICLMTSDHSGDTKLTFNRWEGK